MQKKLKNIGIEPRAVLLLDNCSAHPDEAELVSRDRKVIAKFLPPNVTSLIQPMDQGILVSIKRHYKRNFLEELVFQEDDDLSIVTFLKSINMLKVYSVIAASWDGVSPSSLQLSWRNILTNITSDQSISDRDDAADSSSEDDCCVRDCGFILKELGYELEDSEIEEWLEVDSYDHGYGHLNDDEIIFDVTEQSSQDENNDGNPDEAVHSASHGSVMMAIQMKLYTPLLMVL